MGIVYHELTSNSACVDTTRRSYSTVMKQFATEDDTVNLPKRCVVVVVMSNRVERLLLGADDGCFWDHF